MKLEPYNDEWGEEFEETPDPASLCPSIEDAPDSASTQPELAALLALPRFKEFLRVLCHVLSAQELKIFYDYFIDSQTPSAIAAKFGMCSLGTVTSYASRISAKLLKNADVDARRFRRGSGHYRAGCRTENPWYRQENVKSQPTLSHRSPSSEGGHEDA